VITASAVGTVEDMRELVALAADGRIATHVGRRGELADLPEVLGELDAATYPGRAVLSIG
jgi:D-arabinose 1-dehydrogenase-like Zn-dependent alcohol dehydrogenase